MFSPCGSWMSGSTAGSKTGRWALSRAMHTWSGSTATGTGETRGTFLEDSSNKTIFAVSFPLHARTAILPGMGADMESKLPGPGAPPPCHRGSACCQPPACQLSAVGHAGVPAGLRPEIRRPDGPLRNPPRQHLVAGGIRPDRQGPAAFHAAGPVDFLPPSP